MNRRLVTLAGGLVAVVIAVAMLTLRVADDGIPLAGASSSGQIPSLISLADDERAEIDYSDEGCRSWHNWSFVLYGGSDHRMAIIDAGGSYDGGVSGSDRPSAIGAISLSARDCRGLRDLLARYRQPDPSLVSTATTRVRVSYFRGTRRIGVEEFIDHDDVDYWLHIRDVEGRVPVSTGVTPEMISFRELVRRASEANQTPEPTATLVTPRADARVAPSAAVAHL